MAGLAGVLAIALVSAGCAAGGPRATGTTPQPGGLVSYALTPTTSVNYIFPFTSINYFTQANSDNLQFLLYRPLYWFGRGNGTPYLNETLSLAYPPTYHGRVVTIKLKHYNWSDGTHLTPVSASDVVFWIHMLQAVGAQDWGGYVPHEFPTNVRSVRAVSPTEVQLVMKANYSPQWFTYNELSQITPIPQYWDRTAASAPSDCTANVSDCAAVYSYLSSQAATPSTWVKSPLWSVIDGPWRLTGVSTQGALTFTYNPHYSGPVPRAHITQFKELPFTSEDAEFNVLQSGGSNALDVGYLPTVDAPVPPPGRSVGQNPVPGYHLQALYAWGLNYFPYNFNPATDPQAAAIFDQVYFRQAFQDLVNQAAIIQGPLHGYGKVSTGVVGDYPRTTYLSPLARQGDPFPYNPGQAHSLLVDHGWNVNPGGISTCVKPGSGPTQCGRGVHAGAKLNFSLLYASGTAWLEAGILQLKSNASEVGINLNLTSEPTNSVLNTLGPVCGASHNQPCPWQLIDWGQGWSYAPDYMPTGEELFQTNANGNVGGYSNGGNDRLIATTLLTSDKQAMWRWQNLLTAQLPVVLQPEAPTELVESIDNLHIGVQETTLGITPEDWYYVGPRS
jgi:peptide/nickel transport system substrate-binding protein